MLGEHGGQTAGLILDEGGLVVLGAVLLLSDEGDEFLTSAHQGGELLLLEGAGLGDGWLERASVVGEHVGVERIGLGQQASGSGEVAGLSRVEQGEGDAGLVQGCEQVMLVAAGGLADDLEGGGKLAQSGDKGAMSCGGVGIGASFGERGMSAEFEPSSFMWTAKVG